MRCADRLCFHFLFDEVSHNLYDRINDIFVRHIATPSGLQVASGKRDVSKTISNKITQESPAR